MRILLLVSLAMLAFAANSILARLALSDQVVDPLAYTGIRLVSGGVMLLAIVWLRNRYALSTAVRSGSWVQTAALVGYALAFSLAYGWLGAATGALILFASVQVGMVARAIASGDRPGTLEWFGLALAMGALVYLVSPGLAAPDPIGAIVMVISGLCWATYSLLGRASVHPLEDTAGNFLRAAPLGLVLLAGGLMMAQPQWQGVALAMASGAIASGLGYAVWYAVLPSMPRTRAAIVQLSVPVLSALGGVLFIGEMLNMRLAVSSLIILGGIAIATLAAGRRHASTETS